MHQKRLAAELRPDPLEELTGFPRTLAGFKGKGWGKRKGRQEVMGIGEREEEGKEESGM